MTLKKVRKCQTLKQKVNFFVYNLLCARHQNKKDAIIIPTGSSLIFKVHLVKENDLTRRKIPKQLYEKKTCLLFIQL